MRTWLLLGAALLLAVVLAVALALRQRPAGGAAHVAGREVPGVESVAEGGASTTKANLTIPPELLQRVALKYETAGHQAVLSGLRTTGTVQANAYRETRVTPLVGGRVTDVRAQLGDSVRQGQSLAIIFSAELAEAQMQYRKVMADLDAFAAQHARAVKLAQLGAISQQELEQAEAHFRSHHAEHEAAQQRLRLLGLSEVQIKALDQADLPPRSEATVAAPATGVITARNVNPGQVVTPADALFSITDLSTVWVIANVYEADFAVLNVGAPATITASAFSGRAFRGRVAYIDPRVDPQTRTAQVRLEVANPGQLFRLGMFVDVALSRPGTTPAVTVPKAALQSVNGNQVVFVPVGTNSFEMRSVQAGEESGGLVRIAGGLAAGERVVTEGSFFLRAEISRR